MKKKRYYAVIIISIIIMTGFIWKTNGQNNENKYKNNYFHINPIAAFRNTFQVSYERILNKTEKGIFISMGICSNNKDIGFVDEFQFKFYLNDINNLGSKKKFQSSFYFSPFLWHKYYYIASKDIYLDGFYSFSESLYETSYDYYNSYSLGLVSGFKGTYGHFVFDVSIGGGYKRTLTNNHHYNSMYLHYDGLYDYTLYTGIYPKFSLLLGFSF